MMYQAATEICIHGISYFFTWHENQSPTENVTCLESRSYTILQPRHRQPLAVPRSRTHPRPSHRSTRRYDRFRKRPARLLSISGHPPARVDLDRLCPRGLAVHPPLDPRSKLVFTDFKLKKAITRSGGGEWDGGDKGLGILFAFTLTKNVSRA